MALTADWPDTAQSIVWFAGGQPLSVTLACIERNAQVHRFPFGAPLLALRQEPLREARAFVLGVYASAVHARWLNPDGSTRVAALAVASEPYIFWRGEGHEEIIESVTIPAEAGRLVPPGGGMNGPSGVALDELYLEPLGLIRQSAWLCDLLPQSRMNSGQEAAVRERYNPLAHVLGLPTASVPPVPSRFATEARVEEIVEEFLSSGAETLITLGDLPLKEFVAPLRLCDKTSIASFGAELGQYGQRHSFSLRGRRFHLLPLVHPRQAARLGAHSPELAVAHAEWVREARANAS